MTIEGPKSLYHCFTFPTVFLSFSGFSKFSASCTHAACMLFSFQLLPVPCPFRQVFWLPRSSKNGCPSMILVELSNLVTRVGAGYDHLIRKFQHLQRRPSVSNTSKHTQPLSTAVLCKFVSLKIKNDRISYRLFSLDCIFTICL